MVVFSWSGCPFCKKAKQLLTDVGAKYTALELDTLPDGKALRAELAQVRDGGCSSAGGRSSAGVRSSGALPAVWWQHAACTQPCGATALVCSEPT